MRFSWLFPGLAALLLVGAARADEPKKKLATYEVPYRLTSTSHIMVRAKLNGKGPFNFIVDTGAPILIVSTPVGKKIGLATDKRGWTTLDRFEIEGGAVRPKQKCLVETPFQLEGMNGMGLAGVELHGMIGYTVLAHYRMEIDFTRDKMKWTELAFQPPPPQSVRGKDTGALAALEFLGVLLKIAGVLSGRQQDTLEPRGYLGMELAEKDGGVVATAVLAKTPAAAAGLKPGDRIEQVDSRQIATLAQLKRQTARITVGQDVSLRIRRGNETMHITIAAGEGL